MKNILREIYLYSQNFKRYWLQYIALFVGVDIFTQLLIIPIFRYVTTGILQAGAIPFISYQNISTIITTHTLIFLCLIVELILLLLVIYGEFAIILLGIREISQERFSFKFLLKETWQTYCSVRISSVLLLTLYFLLVVPFADIIYRTPLLAKIQIPEFILDFMTRNPWLTTGLVLFYLIAFVLGIRLILTLPLMIYEKEKTFTAMKKSWKMTKHKYWWHILSRLIVLGICTSIVLLIFNMLIYVFQVGLDKLPKPIRFSFALWNLSLIQVVSELIAIWVSVVSLWIVINPLNNFTQKIGQINRNSKRFKIIATVFS